MAVQQALSGAQVVLVIIGPRWLAARKPGAPARLEDPADYVRIEIETASAEDVPIIPVLVENARMPSAAELPESLRSLAYRQAHQISDERWSYDTDRLEALLISHGLVSQAAAPSRSAGDAGRRAAAALVKLPEDFLRLLYEPRRFLTMRGSGAADDVLRAVMFLCAVQVLGAVLILQEWPTRSRVVDFLVAAPVLMLLFALLLSIPMYVAWRVAGAAREYQRVVAILFYQCAFVGLALSLAVFVTLVGINMIVPGDVDRLAAAPTLEHAVMVLTALEASPTKQPWIVASLMTGLIALGLCVWLVGSWPAYGNALGRHGVHALAAFVVFFLLVTLPLALLVWAAAVVA